MPAYKARPQGWRKAAAPAKGPRMTAADTMTKAEAIALLGGTQVEAAIRVGITEQAVSNWPKVLSPKIRDRVQAVLWREHVAAREREARRYACALEKVQRDAASRATKPTPQPA